MVFPSNFFLKLKPSSSSASRLKISGAGFRGMIAGAATGAFYVAANFMIPEHFAFGKFDPAYITSPDNAASAVVLFCPAIAGAAGFVLPPHIKNILQIFKIVPRRGEATMASGSATAEAATAAPSAAAGQQAVEVVTAAPASAAQEQASAQLAPPPPLQAPNNNSMEDTVAMIEDMVTKKVGEVVTDVTSMKNEVASFRDDISKLKGDIQNLTLSFESSLTDLKAFQAEMVNPLNFMRKYFETMDIKNLSDPIQGLPHVELPAAKVQGQKKEEQTAAVEEQKPKVHDNDDDKQQTDIIPAEKKPLAGYERGDDDSDVATSKASLEKLLQQQATAEARDGEATFQQQHQHLLSQAEKLGDEVSMVTGYYKQGNENGNGNGNGHANPLFQGNLTLGKLMSMVSILDKLLCDMGPDELEALIEQYRQFGLKAEDEAAIYKVVGMLKDFGMSADEAMIRLYRLGQIMGIKDAQADLEYAKLKARSKSAKNAPAAAAAASRAGTYRRNADG
jgi:hypothetical protein